MKSFCESFIYPIQFIFFEWLFQLLSRGLVEKSGRRPLFRWVMSEASVRVRVAGKIMKHTYLYYPLEQLFSKCGPLTSSVGPLSKCTESKTLGVNPNILFVKVAQEVLMTAKIWKSLLRRVDKTWGGQISQGK